MVVFSLLRSGEQFRERAALDARRDAQEQARRLRAALDEPAVLAQVPPRHRFELRGAALQIPPEVGWLAPRPAVVQDALASARLCEAQRAEFVALDQSAAGRCYDELLSAQVTAGDAALALTAAAAWQAQRSGSESRRGELLAKVDAAFRGASAVRTGQPEFAAAVASAALLHQAQGGPLPEWVPVLLPALPVEVQAPLSDRLRELGADTARVDAAAAELQQRRALLVQVSQALAAGPRRGASMVRDQTGDRLLLFQPGADAETGAGALLPPAELLRAMRLPAVGEAVGDALAPSWIGKDPGDGEEVVPGLWYVLPRPLPEPGLLARPSAATAAVVALGIVFLGSAFLGLRALRREADAVRARADFLTVVTHELKTPLASIRLIGEMLFEDRVPAGKQAEYYGLLAGEAARLSMLIENVLDLGRMERGERAYDLRPCDLLQVVREAALLFRPLAQRDRLTLQLSEGDGRSDGEADRGALLQALLNVLDNARKYAASGGRIEVTAAPGDGAMHITVRDHGPGVPVAERESIFDRFRRGSAHQSGAIPGVGLGLHLARAIVQRHGGRLVCEAPAGGGPGAQFTFTLPLVPIRRDKE